MALNIRSPEIAIAGVSLLIAIAALGDALVSVSGDRQGVEAAKPSPSAMLALQLERRFHSSSMRRDRGELARSLLRDRRPPASDRVLTFLDRMADDVQRGALDIDTGRNLFGDVVTHYWPAVAGYVAARRSGTGGNALLYQRLEWLNRAVLLEDAERQGKPLAEVVPRPAEVRAFLEDEAALASPRPAVEGSVDAIRQASYRTERSDRKAPPKSRVRSVTCFLGAAAAPSR